MTDHNKPDAVIFDWDNTLVDSFPLLVEAHSHVRRKFGLETFTVETASQYVHKSARAMYPEWFGQNSDQAISDLYDFIQKRHIQELEVNDHSQECLDVLHSLKIPMAVVSNKRGDLLRKEASHLNWAPYFKTIIGAGDADRDKPDTDPALLALTHLKQKASRCIWYLGDSESDFKVSNALGFTSIYIKNRTMMDQKTLNMYDIEYKFDTMTSFLDFIKKKFEIA